MDAPTDDDETLGQVFAAGEDHGWAAAKSHSARKAAARRAAQEPTLFDSVDLVKTPGGPVEVVTRPDGTELVRLPDGEARVLPSLCEANWLAVCRQETDAYLDVLVAEHAITPSIQALLLRLAIWADPWTGVVAKTLTDIGKALGVHKATVGRWLNVLAAIGIVTVDYRHGAADGTVTFLDLEVLARLAREHRVGQAVHDYEEEVIERTRTTTVTEVVEVERIARRRSRRRG